MNIYNGDVLNSEEIFTCKKCGQVYYISPPEVCMRHGCSSIDFEQISEDNVLNMHDALEYIIKRYIEKLFKFFGIW